MQYLPSSDVITVTSGDIHNAQHTLPLVPVYRRQLNYSRLALFFFFFSSRRRHTRLQGDWSSDVCSSDLICVVFQIQRNCVEMLRVFTTPRHEFERRLRLGRWRGRWRWFE